MQEEIGLRPSVARDVKPALSARRSLASFFDDRPRDKDPVPLLGRQNGPLVADGLLGGDARLN